MGKNEFLLTQYRSHTWSLNQKIVFSQALIAQAYIPSYSGGRDQEDYGSKPSRANSL
jgi:hypothetical protein